MIYILLPTTPVRSERLKGAIQSIKASICNQPIEIKLEVSQGEGALKPLLRLIDSTDGICLCMSDDAVVAPDAIQILYDTYMRVFPDQDGLCVPSDGITKGEVAGFFFAHTKTLAENIHRAYFHNFADRDLSNVMKIKGKYCAVPEAVITHTHYSQDKSLDDSTYQLNESHSDTDGAIFRERHARHYDLP